MIWCLVEVFFYIVATYMNQLDVSRLFVEKYIAEKQDQQLRDYLGNLKDGIIVFKQLEDKESNSTLQHGLSTQKDKIGNEVLF